MTPDPTRRPASIQPLATADNKGGTPQARLAAIGALLLHGASRREVLELTATWGISTRSADRLLAAARAQIVADWEIERPQLTAELLGQLSTLEQQAREVGALGVALACINARARLAGLL